MVLLDEGNRECVGWDKSGVASEGIQGGAVDKFNVGQ